MRHTPGRWSLSTAAAALLLLGACGDDAAPPTGGASTTTTQAQGATPATTTPSVAGIVCENPPPEEIGLGSTVNGELTEVARNQCFWVEVPEGLDTVSFELTGLTADLDLNVGYGFLDTVQYHYREFWRSKQDGTDDKLVVIEDPPAGPYYLMVSPAGFDDFSSFALQAATTPEMTATPTGANLPAADSCPKASTEVDIGSSTSSELVGRDGTPHARVYFCVRVPAGLGSLTVDVSGLEDYLDLEVRLVSANQQWGDWNRGGTERSVVVENPVPGVYYIDLASALSGASSTFTLNVGSS